MATVPYTTRTISGYNAGPPANDGSEVDSNKLDWDKHTGKLSGPVKTLSEAINTELVTAFGKVINTDANENNAMAGSLAITESTLTIASGSVTATRSAHIIAAETGTSDTLNNIVTSSVTDGCILHIRPDFGDTITVGDAATGAGEIHMADDADFVMSSDKSITLQMRTPDWYEISRSTSTAPAFESVSTAALTTATTISVQSLAAGYDYIFVLEAFAPTSDAQSIWLRFEDSVGVQSGAADYTWNVALAAAAVFDYSDSEIELCGTRTCGNDAANACTMSVTVINPNATGERTTCFWSGVIMDAQAIVETVNCFGGGIFIQGTEAVIGVQFLWSGGSTFKAQGDITAWRRKRS